MVRKMIHIVIRNLISGTFLCQKKNYPFIISIFLLMFCSGFAAMNENPVQKMIRIDHLGVNESENIIKMQCSFLDKNLVNGILSDEFKLLLTIHQKGFISKDVVIKKITRLSENSVLLSIQPPLTTSIYKTEKRTFELEFVAGNKISRISKRAVLGSAIRTFDLRPYTYNDPIPLLINSLLIVVFLSLVLLLITPLYQKYKFKKNHIQKYVNIREDGGQDLDPFTFQVIQDKDEIVMMDNQMMLLSSWKTLNELPESKPAKNHSMFFKERLEGTFFNPKTSNFKKINKAWFGLIGILIGWLLYIILLEIEFLSYIKILSYIFDNNQLQVSTVIAHDVIIGFSVGFCYALAIAIGSYFYNKDQFSYRLCLHITFRRTLLIWFAFLISSLVVSYFVENFYIASFITWIFVGFAFTIPLKIKAVDKKKIGLGLVTGFITFLLHLVLNLQYTIDHLGTITPLLLCILHLGIVSVFIIDAKGVKKESIKQFLQKLAILSEQIILKNKLDNNEPNEDEYSDYKNGSKINEQSFSMTKDLIKKE